MNNKVSLIALGLSVSTFCFADYGSAAEESRRQEPSAKQSVFNSQTEIHSLQSAAKLGDADAQYRLGLAYLEGRGVKKSENEAYDWLGKAARNGNTEACFTLGLMYADWEESDAALHWLNLAADKGHPGALHAYKYMLENDFGVGC